MKQLKDDPGFPVKSIDLYIDQIEEARKVKEINNSLEQDVTDFGFNELKSAEAVEEHFEDHKGTSLIVINSVCGCAAGTARPGTIASLQLDKSPDHLTTVFAGVDVESTNKAREMMIPQDIAEFIATNVVENVRELE